MDIDIKLAQKAIINLSSLLRTLLVDAQKSRVSLGSEIEILLNYINLEKLRFGPNMKFTYALEIEDPNLSISPRIFMPLLENAFKYGSHPCQPCFITIQIKEQKGILNCHIENSVFKAIAPSQVKSGLGLANMCERLNLEYKSFHTYSHKIKDNVYISDLKIILK